MVRPLDEPLPDAPLPVGLEVRPVLPERYRQIWAAIDEAFQEHWGWTPSDEAENQAYRRQRGMLYSITVRRPWRKRGLARALIVDSLQMFKQMGMTEAALDVDTENLTGALRLYQSIGFRPVKRTTIYRKPLHSGVPSAPHTMQTPSDGCSSGQT
jgi:ribosomal protein S18 acetylase RimI-like enzyme